MDYKGYVEELKNKCDVFLQQVKYMGNENAYTDRLLEDVFTSVERLKDFYYKSDVVEDEVKAVQTMDELRTYLDEKGWSIYDCVFGPDSCPGWELSKYSPAGEDFSFAVEHNNNVEEAIEEIKRYAYDFDVDEHVEMWVSARGNVSGVPDVSTLVEDAKAIQEMLDELAEGVEFCEPEEEKSIEEVLADAAERSEDLDNGEEKSGVELGM